MNIVFITTLYPDNKAQSLTEVPYALHYFVKEWKKKGNNVQVIKIEAKYPRYLPKYNKTNKNRVVRDTLIDEVPIRVIQVKKKLNREFSESDSKNAGRKVAEFLANKEFKCDVIIFHVFNPSYFIAESIKVHFKAPVIFGVHQTDLNWLQRRNSKKKLKLYEKSIDGFAFRSNSLKNKFEKILGKDSTKFVIPSGISEKSINDDRITKKNNTSYITVSNLIKRKNIDIAIRAFSKMENKNNITLTIIGDGEERLRLQNLVNELNLSKNIIFLGHLSREKVLLELDKHDFFILPSINETFGVVYLEAMARSCIPIGIKNEGIDGVIQNGINGYLIEPTINGVISIMKTIEKLDKDRIFEIKNNVSETIRSYTDEKAAENYIQNIKKTIERRQNDE